MTTKDFRRFQRLPAEIERQKTLIQRLRDAAGVKSPRWDSMPHGSGAHDRIGELIPALVDAEADLARLEREYDSTRWCFSSWVDCQQDLKAGLILSCRYLDQMPWEQVADQVSSCEGETASPDSVRKYADRYLKQHLEKETENNGQDGR